MVSRKIARSLGKGSLHGIHIFDRELEELRSLNREPIPLEFDNNQWILKFVSWTPAGLAPAWLTPVGQGSQTGLL